MHMNGEKESFERSRLRKTERKTERKRERELERLFAKSDDPITPRSPLESNRESS